MLALAIGVIGGIATTVQASINTESRKFFRSPFIVAGLNFTVAWIILAAFIIISEHRFYIPLGTVAENPPWIWLGGVCAIIIVTLGILCVPKLGAAGNVMVLNFGQIVTGLVIDHFALFGSEEARMSLTRLAGAIMVFGGLILVTRDKKNGKSTSADFFHFRPPFPPLRGSFPQETTSMPCSSSHVIIRLTGLTAKLAPRRLSAAFRKAISIQQARRELPPRETNGNVTPVKGSISSVPKTFSAS